MVETGWKMTSETIGKLAEALAKAQSVMVNPEKNKTAEIPMKSGGRYKYNYSDLPSTFDVNRKHLSDNGISHSSVLFETHKGFSLGMILMHSSGEWIRSEYPLPSNVDDKAMASSITYGRRYLFQALTGIAGDDDLDSEPVSGASYDDKKKASKAQSDVNPIKPVVSVGPYKIPIGAKKGKMPSELTDQELDEVLSGIEKVDKPSLMIQEIAKKLGEERFNRTSGGTSLAKELNGQG